MATAGEFLRQFPFARALRDSVLRGYSAVQLRGDIMAGITVGIVSIPLAMALAIASGAPPQYGLYTSVVAGAVIALTGGSALNISGPTAAFVVILLPISHQFGLGGLLTASVMAGIMLVLMGAFRLGRFIRFIPYPVTTGFTAGIGVVIGFLQLKNFLGLDVTTGSAHFLGQLRGILSALPTVNWLDLAIGLLTLLVLRYWPAVKTHVPSHLVALAVASVVGVLLTYWNADTTVTTIGSLFHWEIGDASGTGIPPFAPDFLLPWQLPNAEGQASGLTLHLLRELMAPAFTIAMLGAIESLLCAVVADGMAGTRHDPDSELVGQGIGNIIGPFFGSIPATAAIARTATNVRAGGRTPIAALTHSAVILLALVVLAPALAYLPMASLSALLMMVAWRMSEAKQFMHIVRISQKGDVAVLLACFFSTVIFDMVVAVAVGLILAALIFIRRMVELTGSALLDHKEHEHLKDLPPHVAVYDIDGPLFFGAADKTVSALHQYKRTLKTIIMDMTDVPMMDLTGMLAFKDLVETLNEDGVKVIIACLDPVLGGKLQRAGIAALPGKLVYCDDLAAARDAALA
jgi:SulP family sulfate permease